DDLQAELLGMCRIRELLGSGAGPLPVVDHQLEAGRSDAIETSKAFDSVVWAARVVDALRWERRVRRRSRADRRERRRDLRLRRGRATGRRTRDGGRTRR